MKINKTYILVVLFSSFFFTKPTCAQVVEISYDLYMSENKAVKLQFGQYNPGTTIKKNSYNRNIDQEKVEHWFAKYLSLNNKEELLQIATGNHADRLNLPSGNEEYLLLSRLSIKIDTMLYHIVKFRVNVGSNEAPIGAFVFQKIDGEWKRHTSHRLNTYLFGLMYTRDETVYQIIYGTKDEKDRIYQLLSLPLEQRSFRYYGEKYFSSQPGKELPEIPEQLREKLNW